MLKFVVLCCVLAGVHGQVLNRVHVLRHKEYILDVINEVMKRVEEQGWWNLPLTDHGADYNENLLTWKLKGNVKYTNGFVASIQKISILETSLNQIWTSTNGVKVEIQGQLRIEDLAIGADIVSNLTLGLQRHTGLINYPLATFDFSVFRDVLTHEMTVTVSGDLPRSTAKIVIMPMDKLADALVLLFDSGIFKDDVSSWGPAVFQPLAEDIVKTETVKFPDLCYDCAVPKPK